MSAHAALADESHLMSCLILKSHVALFPEIDVLCHIVLLLPLFLLDSPLTYRLHISEDDAKIRHFAKMTKCLKRFRTRLAILFLIQKEI